MLADDGDAHMLHGTVLEAQGDLKGALTAFDKAIGLMPDDPRPIVSSGPLGTRLRVRIRNRNRNRVRVRVKVGLRLR